MAIDVEHDEGPHADLHAEVERGIVLLFEGAVARGLGAPCFRKILVNVLASMVSHQCERDEAAREMLRDLYEELREELDRYRARRLGSG